MYRRGDKSVKLNVGEECVITGSGTVVLRLKTGVLEVAGAALDPDVPFTCSLDPDCRALVAYSLEGGTGRAVGDGVAVHNTSSSSGAAALTQFVQRRLAHLARSTVLVLGRARRGKTLTAHTVCNLLQRVRQEQQQQGAAEGRGRVVYVTLNSESNDIVCPGCVSAAELPADGAPLVLGLAASPALTPLSLYVGSAAPPAAQDARHCVHFYEQLLDTLSAYLGGHAEQTAAQQQQRAGRAAAGAGTGTHVVVEAPAPAEDLPESAFYRGVLAAVRPTHVLLVAGRETAEEEGWATALVEDAQRTHPDCDFTFVRPAATPLPFSPRRVLLREYFCGSAVLPLGCAKVVVPARALTFVQYGAPAAGGGGGVSAIAVPPSPAWRGCVVALSHAEMLEEVPLAPVLALLLIVDVDTESGEVVLVTTAHGGLGLDGSGDSSGRDGGALVLPRRFVVVPNDAAGSGSGLRLAETQIASVEESVVPT